MVQSPRFLTRRNQFSPRVEPLEDRLLLSRATLPDPSPGNVQRYSSALASAPNAESAEYLTNPLPGVAAPGVKADPREDLDVEKRYDHREVEAGERLLGAVLAAYLPALKDVSHAAATPPQRNETLPSSPSPPSVGLPPTAVPVVAERIAILTPRSKEPESVGFADDALAPPGPNPSTGSTEVVESQPSIPHSGDPPTAEIVPTTALPLDTPAFDLSAMKREIDGFFAHLADLGAAEYVGVSVPLVPTALVVTALAYEFSRQWRRRRTAAVLPTDAIVFDPTQEYR
jgi:hypothetical protein